MRFFPLSGPIGCAAPFPAPARSSNWKAPSCSSRGNGPKSSRACWGISGDRKRKTARGLCSRLPRPRAGKDATRARRPTAILAGVPVSMNDVFRLRRVGKRVAGFGQERVAETIAATAGGHRLTLLHVVETAGYHGGSHVLPAIFACRSRRRKRDNGQRAQRSSRLQKLFHVALSVFSVCRLFSRTSQLGCRWSPRHACMADPLANLLLARVSL